METEYRGTIVISDAGEITVLEGIWGCRALVFNLAVHLFGEIFLITDVVLELAVINYAFFLMLQHQCGALMLPGWNIFIFTLPLKIITVV